MAGVNAPAGLLVMSCAQKLRSCTKIFGLHKKFVHARRFWVEKYVKSTKIAFMREDFGLNT